MIKKVKVNDQELSTEVHKLNSDEVKFDLEGQELSFKIIKQTSNELILQDENCKLYKFTMADEQLIYKGNHYNISAVSNYDQNNSTQDLGNSLIAPLPGKVISIEVSEGETIMKEQTIAVIEAMKMEHRILAYKSGYIAKLYIKEGDSIPEGFVIGEIDEQ